LVEVKRRMYFDWCENPEELRKAIGDLLSGTTFVRATMTGPGAHAVTLIGPNEDGILKQAFLEARSVGEKLRKRCPSLPALPDTQCVPLEGMGRMVAWCREAAAKWVEPIPTDVESRQMESEGLRAKADKVHELLVRNKSVRERFREQDRLFYKKLKCWWQANEACEAALRPFDEKIYDCDNKRRRCVAEMAKLQKQGLRTSPKYAQLEEDNRRLIEEKAKAKEAFDVAKGGLQDPGPCPAEWLEPPAGGDLAPNARRVLEYMFPDDDPAMSDEAVRLRAYVLLTIVHDHAFKREVSLIADADVWPRDDEDVPDDFALTAWKNMEANPSWSCGAIDRALRIVQADLDLHPKGIFDSGEVVTATTGKAKRRSRRKAKAAIASRFTKWRSPGDVCFIIDGARMKFHLNGVVKDLRLRSGSRAEKLLKLLAAGSLTKSEIKEYICTPKTKPYEAVRDVNRLLSIKVKGLGFQAVPANTEFVGCDDRTGQYFCHLPIKSQDEWERE